PGGSCIEGLTVCFDLELDSGTPERFGDLEEMRDDEWLAPAEDHVGDRIPGDLVGHAQRFACVELVGQPLAGRRVGTAMQAAEIAISRQLPRDEQRRAQL